jgi:hypothetical protein
MSRPKKHPNVRKLKVTLTIEPMLLTIAKLEAYKEGVSLSEKVERLLAFSLAHSESMRLLSYTPPLCPPV